MEIKVSFKLPIVAAVIPTVVVGRSEGHLIPLVGDIVIASDNKPYKVIERHFDFVSNPPILEIVCR